MRNIFDESKEVRNRIREYIACVRIHPKSERDEVKNGATSLQALRTNRDLCIIIAECGGGRGINPISVSN